jgi:hypothetical protein
VADLKQLKPEFEALRWVSEHAVPRLNLSPDQIPTLMSTRGYDTLLKEKYRYLRALAFHHTRSSISPDERDRIIYAGTPMGITLQYVNIARDIAVDAKMNQVYFPEITLLQDDLTANDVIENPIRRIRSRLLDKAFKE